MCVLSVAYSAIVISIYYPNTMVEVGGSNHMFLQQGPLCPTYATFFHSTILPVLFALAGTGLIIFSELFCHFPHFSAHFLTVLSSSHLFHTVWVPQGGGGYTHLSSKWGDRFVG